MADDVITVDGPAGAGGRGSWGRREFDSATSVLRDTGYLVVLKTAIGAACLSLVVLGVIVQLHPLGPRGVEHRVIHGLVLASAAAMGLRWLYGPWPTHRGAVAFVVWGDLSIATCAIVMAAPAGQLNTTIHMGLIGVFAAFLLGWRVLAAHCVFATTTILGLTAWAVLSGQATLLDLYIYYDPALTSVVVLPVVIQAVIEAVRRSIGRTSRQAVRDPLTGLYNRRGMRAAVTATLDTLVTAPVMAIAVIDLDDFKTLNDTRGHHAGDTALREIAHHLHGIVRHDGDLVARTGGDEFIVIAYLNTIEGLASFSKRCAALHDDPSLASTSIGIAGHPTGDPNFDLDTLLHHADTAMYEAKRAGGRHLALHTGDSTTGPQ